MATVREVTFGVLRRLGVRTIFGNPGSTEMLFLKDLRALDSGISPNCAAPAVACAEDHCYDEPGQGELPTQYDTGTG